MASQGHEGNIASKLGALNAAHASPTALSHASSTSEVGKIAAYANAMNAYSAAVSTNEPQKANEALESAAQSLAAASNKAVTTSTVDALNSQLGLSVSPSVSAQVAAKAAALQGSH